MNPPITITGTDHTRLRRLIAQQRDLTEQDAATLAGLSAELDRATVVPDDEIPEGVIRMNSAVELENLTDNSVLNVILAYPEEADIETGRISVLAPLGAGMLGFRAGDEFEWPLPGGTARVRIRKVGPVVDGIDIH